jgi:hypothetical protein
MAVDLKAETVDLRKGVENGVRIIDSAGVDPHGCPVLAGAKDTRPGEAAGSTPSGWGKDKWAANRGRRAPKSSDKWRVASPKNSGSALGTLHWALPFRALAHGYSIYTPPGWKASRNQ